MLEKDLRLAAPPLWRISEYRFLVLALFLALLAVYGNSLNGDWHFDDYRNIVDNANLHMHVLSWEEIKRALTGLPGEGMTRPLAYLSFALNYYIGRDDVLGFHLTNLLIHYLTAIILFLFIHRTLNLPRLKDQYGKHSYSIALLSTFLWVLHPIQVLAVTYVVQRMASMAAMFYLLAMLFYLLARSAEKKAGLIGYSILAVLSASLSLATKENSATLPLAILLYDLFFFQGISRENLKKFLWRGLLPLLLLLLVGLFLLGPAKFVGGYSIRPFTMGERLLTEPRVMFFYLSLLLYPVSSRFTLLHDLDLSTGLLVPWTTLPAILLTLALLAAAFAYARRWPLFSYCLIFFFLNHVIEGSILPLEIVYEHRNYLPSMLFFVPLAVILIEGLHYFREKKALFRLLAASVTFFLFLEGLGVVTRNNALKTELSLWLDNREKSPDLHRVRHNLAIEYTAAGLLLPASEEFLQALKGKAASVSYEKYDTYFSLGQVCRVRGNDDLALQQFAESIKLFSSFPDVYQAQAEIMMSRGRLDEAERAIRRALYLNSRLPSFHLTYAEILLKRGNPDGALGEAKKALLLRDASRRTFRTLAAIFRIKGDAVRTAHFERLSQKNDGVR